MSTKTVAVCCLGYKIILQQIEAYDKVIAVNRASGFVHADYTVCADYQAVETFVPMNCETIFIADTYNSNRIRNWHHLPKERIIAFEPPPGVTKSIFLAIWFAANILSAKEIDVFGARWSGVEDADGYTEERHKRSEKRWRDEEAEFFVARRTLAKRGIVLRRIVPEGESGNQGVKEAETGE